MSKPANPGQISPSERVHNIRVSKEIHDALGKAGDKIGMPLTSTAKVYGDGTVSFDVAGDVYAAMMQLSNDPELALRMLLEMKGN